MLWKLTCTLASILLLPSSLSAQALAAPDQADTAATDEIARATTEPRFLSPWVAYLPASATVPSPRAFLHRIAGAPGELVNSARLTPIAVLWRPRRRAFASSPSDARRKGGEIVLVAIADEKGI